MSSLMNSLRHLFRIEVLMPLYEEYTKEDRAASLEKRKNYVRKVSPMNTEPCRKYLERVTGQKVLSEDVLWCFYNIDNEEEN